MGHTNTEIPNLWAVTCYQAMACWELCCWSSGRAYEASFAHAWDLGCMCETIPLMPKLPKLPPPPDWGLGTPVLIGLVLDYMYCSPWLTGIIEPEILVVSCCSHKLSHYVTGLDFAKYLYDIRSDLLKLLNESHGHKSKSSLCNGHFSCWKTVVKRHLKMLKPVINVSQLPNTPNTIVWLVRWEKRQS